MLLQRSLTALVLLLVIVPLTLLNSATPFFWLSAGILALGMWEWAKLNSATEPTAVALSLVFFAFAGWIVVEVDLSEIPNWIWVGATVAWVFWGTWMLCSGLIHWARIPFAIRLGLGFLVLFIAWLAAAKARLLGVQFLFSVFMLVWASDIGAYFFGKTFGLRLFKRKLAPSISPGKSREGAIGGAVVAVFLGLIWWYFEPAISTGSSLYMMLMAKGIWVWLACMLGLVVFSIVGDLVESMVKRVAGAKDSSCLLPGHGGVLDRIDAMLPTLPAALALTLGLFP